MTPHNNHCFRVLNDTILFANSILTIYVSIFFFFFFFVLYLLPVNHTVNITFYYVTIT